MHIATANMTKSCNEIPVQYVSYRNLHRGHMSINRAMGLTPRLPPVATEVDSTCLDFLGKVENNRRDCLISCS